MPRFEGISADIFIYYNFIFLKNIKLEILNKYVLFNYLHINLREIIKH